MKFLKLKFQRKKLTPDLPIPKGALTWLMFCLFLSIGWHLWHIPEIPVWALVAVVPMSIFSYRRIIKGKPLPSPVLRIGLTIAAVAGVILTYSSPLGRDAGITTLILLSSLKLMELKTRRDFMFIVFMCYFIVFGNFLYDQSLLDLTFMILAVILVTAAVLRLNHPDHEPVKLSFLLKFSFRLFLLALPLTVILFLLFPRTYGPFWNIPQKSGSLQSGFRSYIRPGDVAELAKSNATAFKVEFPGNNMPGQKDLYFRGLVLWFTTGKTWYQGRVPSRFSRSRSLEGEGILQYITLQPHNKKWLFALDRPVRSPRWSRTFPGNIFQALWDLKTPIRYGVLSRTDAGLSFLPKVHRKWALDLPEEVSSRIMALGQKWRDNASTIDDILRQAENYFKENGFLYSLNPGQMDQDDPLGDFLFNKRQGFCEHFAASFTLLMRAAGVPARVVVGYQGGEYNPVGKYLEVRQSEAHAWAEVWVKEEETELNETDRETGWQRVDPTAWVSPVRIEYGLEMSQQILANLTGDDRDEAIQQALRGNIFKRAWKFLENHWENIKYKWDAWIITYDIFQQRNFLSSLGLGRVGRLSLLLAILILVPILLFIISAVLKRKALSSDQLVRLYLRFCSKLERLGLQRLRWEGPVHFEHRALEKFPKKAEVIQQVTDLFVHLRYGRLVVTKERLKQLKRHIRKL
jgi:transglutaminase-like putative cysteine protease